MTRRKFRYLKVREFLIQKIVKIRTDHENAAAEAGYVIFRLLSSHLIAFPTRRISFKHHPFSWINYSLIIKWKIPLLTAEDIWFKCDLYLRFIPPITLWKICIDMRPFSKYFNEPFSRTLRSPRSNNLEIQNDENYKWKLVKTRWNPKFVLSDLKNDLLTLTTSEEAEWIFSKIILLKSVHQAETNEL